MFIKILSLVGSCQLRSLCVGFDLIYFGFGLLVKVKVIILLTYQQTKKVLVLLGEVKLKSELYESLILLKQVRVN